jgi:hypothetical protein
MVLKKENKKVFFKNRNRLSIVCSSDLYGLRWALSFAGETFYAVRLPCGVRLLFRVRMSRRICPVEHVYRADFYADSVAGADVPVNSHGAAVYAQLLRRFNRSPDVVTLMLGGDFAVLLEVRVYRQDDSPPDKLRRENINSFAFFAERLVL